MTPLAKVGLVSAGYFGAFAVASAVVTVYIAATSGPDRQNYGPYRVFWAALSVAGLVISSTAVAAFLEFLSWRGANPQSVASAWSALAGLRILIAPLFAAAFVVSAVMAPSRRPRLALLAATAMEAAAFVGYAARVFHR